MSYLLPSTVIFRQAPILYPIVHSLMIGSTFIHLFIHPFHKYSMNNYCRPRPIHSWQVLISKHLRALFLLSRRLLFIKFQGLLSCSYSVSSKVRSSEKPSLNTLLVLFSVFYIYWSLCIETGNSNSTDRI